MRISINFMYEHKEQYTRSDDNIDTKYIEKQLQQIFILILITLVIVILLTGLSCGRFNGERRRKTNAGARRKRRRKRDNRIFRGRRQQPTELSAVTQTVQRVNNSTTIRNSTDNWSDDTDFSDDYVNVP